MATNAPRTAEDWCKVCLDLETEQAVALKAISRLGAQRGKIALKAKLGDIVAAEQLECLRSDEIRRQIEAGDLAAALKDARNRLAAAQGAEKAAELTTRADRVDEGVTGHERAAKAVDKDLARLVKSLSAWAVSSKELFLLTGDMRGTVSRRNDPTQQNAALFFHGLAEYFEVPRTGGTRGGGRSFAEVDGRFRTQVGHAAARMRAEAKGPDDSEPAELVAAE